MWYCGYCGYYDYSTAEVYEYSAAILTWIEKAVEDKEYLYYSKRISRKSKYIDVGYNRNACTHIAIYVSDQNL